MKSSTKKKNLPKFCFDFSLNGCSITSCEHKKLHPHDEAYNLECLLERPTSSDYQKVRSILSILRRPERNNASYYEKCSNPNKSKIQQYEAILLTDNCQNIKDLKKAEKLFQASIKLDISNSMARYKYAQLLQHELDNTGPFAVIQKKIEKSGNKNTNKNANKTKKDSKKENTQTYVISDARRKEIMFTLEKCYREAIRYESKLTSEQQSELNLDFALFECERNKQDEALIYFAKVDWDYTTREGFDDLEFYIQALFQCNQFQECFQLLQKIDTNNLRQNQRSLVRRLMIIVKKFNQANDEIGDLFDSKKNGKIDKKNKNFFKYWLQDENTNILTLLRFMQLFGIDSKLLVQFIKQTVGNMTGSKEHPINIETQGEKKCNSNSSSSNSNSNSNSIDETIEQEEQDLDVILQLKKKECTDLLKQLSDICGAFGPESSDKHNINNFNRSRNDNCNKNDNTNDNSDDGKNDDHDSMQLSSDSTSNKNEKNEKNEQEREKKQRVRRNMNDDQDQNNKNSNQEKMKQILEKYGKQASQFDDDIGKIEQVTRQNMCYKIENYLEIVNTLKNCQKQTQSQDWQKIIGDININLFSVKTSLQMKRQTVKNTSDTMKKANQQCENLSKAMIKAKQQYQEAKKRLKTIESKKLPLETRIKKLKQNVRDEQDLEKQGDQLLNNLKVSSQKSIQYCEKIYQEYKTHWDTKEQVWYLWSVDDIAAWIVYKINTNDRLLRYNYSLQEKKDMLVNINAKLQDMKYHSTYLRAVTYNTLKEIGFNRENEENVRNWLYKEIHAMCDMYPMPIENSSDCNDGAKIDNDNENSDERFLCPLSGELMQNPVIAVDGNTYENQIIIDYLRQHHKFPNSNGYDMTVESVELAIDMLQENIPLKQEIEGKYNFMPPPEKKQRIGN